MSFSSFDFFVSISLSLSLSRYHLARKRRERFEKKRTVGDLLAADREEQLRERLGADRREQRRHERRDEGLDEVGEGRADDEGDGDVDNLACCERGGRREGRESVRLLFGRF